MRAIAELGAPRLRYELILCENGSKDAPARSARRSPRARRVSILAYHEPNYGGALREGMRRRRARSSVCYEIDFWDVDFVAQALPASIATTS